jgi:ribosomal protein L11 methyltransferase
MVYETGAKNRGLKAGCGERFANIHPKELFIYHLKGLAKVSIQGPGNGFVGDWEEADTTFLFFSRPADRLVADLVANRPDLCFLDRYNMSYAQWLGDEPTPFQEGGLSIVPAWEMEASTPSDREILLDPGVVFGAGNHVTTRDCLSFLPKAFGCRPPEIVLDLGCGTGILALAAAKLGAKKVLAVDYNYLAVKTCAKNIRMNHLEGRVLAVRGKAEDFVEFEADMVMANLHGEIMEKMIESRGFFHKKRFILSGLLRSDARGIQDILNRHPGVAVLDKKISDAVWHTFHGRIQAGSSLLHRPARPIMPRPAETESPV